MKIRRAAIAHAFVLATFAAVDHAGAQQAPPTYRARIVGVFDAESGEPIEGVRVVDLKSNAGVVTDKRGVAHLTFLPDGAGVVRIQKIGYAPQTISVAISAADTTPVTVLLKHAVQLAPVITEGDSTRFVSPSLREFEERRKAHTSGYFLGEEELRKSDSRSLHDLLTAKMPGIRILLTSKSNQALLMKSSRCDDGTHATDPQVFVDGVPLAFPPDLQHGGAGGPVGRGPFDLNDFQISDYAGMEYYPDNTNIPARYGSMMGACGALFLWTRER